MFFLGVAKIDMIYFFKRLPATTVSLRTSRQRVLLAGFLLAAILAVASPSLQAQPNEKNPWLHSFYFENDLFYGTDSNYTNGAKYSLISPDLSPSAGYHGNIPKKILDYIHKLPFISEAPPETAHKIEFSIGQNMYTPTDTETSDLIVDDRPYAGWTYASTSFHRKSTLSDCMSMMDTVEVQLGIIGPASMTEETQTLVHTLRNLDIPQGWDNQLSNEPGLVIAFERKHLFHPDFDFFGYDFISHAGFALGNVATYANAGAEIRCGWNIPKSFGVSLIRPAGSTRMEICDKPGFFFIGAVDARAVARNIFLDGNTWTDSHSVPKNPLVADFAAGFAFNYGRFMVTWAHIFRTETFEYQDGIHDFGSLSLSWFLNF